MRFQKILIKDCRQFPIHKIDFLKKNEKLHHDQIVRLVDSMLVLHKHKAKAETQTEQGMIQRQIDAIDREIDSLVYELYDLTKDEIVIVEKSEAKKFRNAL
jgi:hypothetical protein